MSNLIQSQIIREARIRCVDISPSLINRKLELSESDKNISKNIADFSNFISLLASNLEAKIEVYFTAFKNYCSNIEEQKTTEYFKLLYI
jgi:hypothetical protein